MTGSDQVAQHRLTRLLWTLAIGTAGMAALLALLPAAGHDQLWFLLMARRWLAAVQSHSPQLYDSQLYGPLAFDSNPPGIVWLSAIPVALGSLSHLPATLWAKMMVALLEAGIAAFSFSLLHRAWRQTRPYEATALLFAFVTLFAVVPARDFGQRDHLTGLLLLPYILAAGIDSVRHPLRAVRFAAGVLAATSICLKPHHALVPFTIEAALLLLPRLLTPGKPGDPGPDSRTWASEEPIKPGNPLLTTVSSSAYVGSTDASPAATRLHHLLRPEPLLILFLGALYLLAIHHFAPLYFTQAIPLTRSVYWAIGHLTLPQLLWEAIELCLLAAIALWLFFRRIGSTPAVRLLLLAGAAGFTTYLVQGTGWYYQQLPAISFFGGALALELLDLAANRQLRIPSWLPNAAAALVVLALALTTHFTGYPFTPDRAFAIDSPDPALFASLPPGTPVAILTTSVDEAMMPIERYHLTWAQRMNNLWFLPAILREERSQNHSNTGNNSPRTPSARSAFPLFALESLQHRWMLEDLTRWQPELVLIERCQDEAVRCQILEDRHDDFLAWFRRDPAFATFWQQHYTFLRKDARFDVYQRK